MSKKKTLMWTLALWLTVALVTNPSEALYLSRIAKDYGSIHHGAQLSENQLHTMGKTDRKNFLVFSTYHYQFGNIKVNYLGAFGYIWYKGSFQSNKSYSNKAAFT